MSEYYVTWKVEIEAESPKAAAEQALEIQRDESSTAVCFKVCNEAGDCFKVDLGSKID